jgi:alpha-ribazole phosphatase/probable phosphoglycerate mutase
MTRLLLIRHCEPEPDAAGRCYGSLDFGLSTGGFVAAEELGRALSPVRLDSVVASPRLRALQTAEPIARQAGVDVVADDRLRELDFGELEGLTYEEAERTRPDLYRRWMETPTEVEFPGGESYALLASRVRAAVDELVAAGGTHAVVAHGGSIRAVLAGCLEMPPPAIFRLAQGYGGVSVIDWLEGTPVVRLVNGSVTSAL